MESTDEEGCVDYILNFMQSDALLSSEDEGMSQLLLLNDLVCSIIYNRDKVALSNGAVQEHETLTTMPARIVDHTTPDVNNETSTTRHCTTLPTAATTVHTTQQHIDLHTDTTTENVDQLQVMHKELGKKLQHYKDVASTAQSRHHSLEEPMPHQPTRHTPSKVDTEKIVSLRDLPYVQRRDFKVHGGQIGDQNSDNKDNQ